MNTLSNTEINIGVNTGKKSEDDCHAIFKNDIQLLSQLSLLSSRVYNGGVLTKPNHNQGLNRLTLLWV